VGKFSFGGSGNHPWVIPVGKKPDIGNKQKLETPHCPHKPLFHRYAAFMHYA
jgi:hypothetical protein